jgi:hypothetical protein
VREDIAVAGQQRRSRVARGCRLMFLDADSRASKGLAATVVSRHASGRRAGAIAVAAAS